MYLKEGHRLHNDKYQLLNVLGEGGFSLTYRGAWKTEIQGSLGKIPTLVPICIKEYFFKDYCQRNQQTGFIETTGQTGTEIFEKNKEKIIKEARILSEIHHPNVVNVLEVFKQNNTVYIVMEFISGDSLKQAVEQKGIFSEEKLKKIIYKIGQALDHIHSKNILHLDIKPSNILMDKRNNPKLIDFGISKRYDIADDQQTSTTLQAASKGYASIEQYDSEGIQSFSPRPDIYSLGATMYFLLTGLVPTESILRSTKGLQNPREINPAISKKTEAVVLKAMALHAADRYETVLEMLLDLGYNPETDAIDMNEISGTLAEKTELVKKIKEQPYDADLEDATILHPEEKEKLEKKEDHFWIYLAIFGTIILSAIFIIFGRIHSGPEDESAQQTDSKEWIYNKFFNDGVEQYNKNNLSQAKEQFIDAQEIKDSPEVREYLSKIDSINAILLPTFPEETTTQTADPIPPEETSPTEEVATSTEVDLRQENYIRFFGNALTAYTQGDYKKALPLFEEAAKYDNTSDVKGFINHCKEFLDKKEIEKKLNNYELYPEFGNFIVAMRKSDKMFGLIDKKGEEEIPFEYLNSEPMGENRLFQRSDDMYDLYSPSGKLLKSGLTVSDIFSNE